MDETESHLKVNRILYLYDSFNKGCIVNKRKAAAKFSVSEKAIQRDIKYLRDFFSKQNGESSDTSIIYNHVKNGYELTRGKVWLTQEEVLAIAKILLESRAFPKTELDILLDKIIAQCEPDIRKYVQEVIRNERFHYLPVKHNQPLFNKIWDISFSIREQRVLEINYLKPRGSDIKGWDVISRKVEPYGLIFSEYYFYLIAYVKDSGYEFPATYRLDRIQSYSISDQHYRIQDNNRFEEGEFRKRVQFMRTGKLMQITFRFWGQSLEAVLDRLPTAHVIKQEGNKVEVEAKVFGEGIKMWLLSQAQYLEVLKPITFREDMKKTIQKMLINYT